MRVAGLAIAAATLYFGGCQTVQDTSLHVAFERNARRDGFRRVAVVTEDFYYCYPLTRQVFSVPRGFETDFASIHIWASAIVNPIKEGAEAAVVHIWLYAVGEPGQREQADTIFLYGLQQAHVSGLKSKLMYEAVRSGGASAYGAAAEWRFVDPNTETPQRALESQSAPPSRSSTAVTIFAAPYRDCACFERSDITRIVLQTSPRSEAQISRSLFSRSDGRRPRL